MWLVRSRPPSRSREAFLERSCHVETVGRHQAGRNGPRKPRGGRSGECRGWRVRLVLPQSCPISRPERYGQVRKSTTQAPPSARNRCIQPSPTVPLRHLKSPGRKPVRVRLPVPALSSPELARGETRGWFERGVCASPARRSRFPRPPPRTFEGRCCSCLPFVDGFGLDFGLSHLPDISRKAHTPAPAGAARRQEVGELPSATKQPPALDLRRSSATRASPSPRWSRTRTRTPARTRPRSARSSVRGRCRRT